MTISLSKGGNLSLTKTVPGLEKVTVGLGWDVNSFSGGDFDLDSSAILVGTDGKVINDHAFVFYNNKTSPDGSVSHGGDNLTGQGDGDDEQITVNLVGVPPEADKIVISVSIHEADQRGQNFGMVRNAYVRVVNDADSNEIARYDLTEDASTDTAMVFGELYRNDGGWKFKALGMGYASGLAGIAQDFGLAV